MAMALQGGTLEHVQLAPGVFSGHIAHSTSRDIQLDWGRYNIPLHARGDMSRDIVTLMIAVAGQGPWRVLGELGQAGDMMVIGENSELHATMPKGANWLSLQVSRAQLESVGLALPQLVSSKAKVFPGVISTEMRQSLQDLAAVVGPSQTSPTQNAISVAWAHSELQAMLFRELAQRLGSGEGSSSESPRERWRVICRAQAYLDGLDEPNVRIDALCMAAHTSLSRLERAYHEAFGMSPRRFLTLRRLAAARRDLLRNGHRQTIAEIATRWGFFHFGRFSQDYKALYAELPSQTSR